MRAAVFSGPNTMPVKEIPISNYRGKEALLKVKACAVCGYDARVFRNGHRKVRPPVILGHEICAEALETLSTASGTVIKSRSRVAVIPTVPCLNCHYCHNGHYNICTNLRELGSTLDGGFAEYVKIPEQILKIDGLVPVPDNLSDEEAALLEPLACCLNGFLHTGSITNKSDIAIIGDGPIGLLHLQLSKLYGSKTIVIGKVPSRLDIAKSLGADETITVSDSNIETINAVLRSTKGIGATAVIIATSNSTAFDVALGIASKNSTINVFAGLPNGRSSMLVDANWLHYNQVSITGSFSSTPSILQKAATLVSTRKINLSKIISHRYPLEYVQEAIGVTENYHGLRAVITS